MCDLNFSQVNTQVTAGLSGLFHLFLLSLLRYSGFRIEVKELTAGVVRAVKIPFLRHFSGLRNVYISE